MAAAPRKVLALSALQGYVLKDATLGDGSGPSLSAYPTSDFLTEIPAESASTRQHLINSQFFNYLTVLVFAVLYIDLNVYINSF